MAADGWGSLPRDLCSQVLHALSGLMRRDGLLPVRQAARVAAAVSPNRHWRQCAAIEVRGSMCAVCWQR